MATEPRLVLFVPETTQAMLPGLKTMLETHIRGKTTTAYPVALCFVDNLMHRDDTYLYLNRGLLFVQLVDDNRLGVLRRRVHVLLFRKPGEVLDEITKERGGDKIVVFVVQDSLEQKRETKALERVWLEAQLESRADVHIVTTSMSLSSSSSFEEEATNWVRGHVSALLKTSTVLSEEQTTSSLAFAKAAKAVKIDSDSQLGLRRLWQLQQQFLHSNVANCRKRQCGLDESNVASLARLSQNNFDDVGCPRLRQVLQQMYEATEGDTVPFGGKSASQSASQSQ